MAVSIMIAYTNPPKVINAFFSNRQTAVYEEHYPTNGLVVDGPQQPTV